MRNFNTFPDQLLSLPRAATALTLGATVLLLSACGDNERGRTNPPSPSVTTSHSGYEHSVPDANYIPESPIDNLPSSPGAVDTYGYDPLDPDLNTPDTDIDNKPTKPIKPIKPVVPPVRPQQPAPPRPVVPPRPPIAPRPR